MAAGLMLGMGMGAQWGSVTLPAVDQGGQPPVSDASPMTPFVSSVLALGAHWNHLGCSENPDTQVVPYTDSIRMSGEAAR